MNPDDPQHIGTGSAQSPGGKDAPVQSAYEMTQGQEGYPGPRSAGESDKPHTPDNAQLGNETGANADTPAAGDVDPGSTYSAEETGQDGDPNEPAKNKANAWNG